MAIQLRYTISEATRFDDYMKAGTCIEKYERHMGHTGLNGGFQYRLRPLGSGIIVSAFDEDNKLKGYLYETE